MHAYHQNHLHLTDDLTSQKGTKIHQNIRHIHHPIDRCQHNSSIKHYPHEHSWPWKSRKQILYRRKPNFVLGHRNSETCILSLVIGFYPNLKSVSKCIPPLIFCRVGVGVVKGMLWASLHVHTYAQPYRGGFYFWNPPHEPSSTSFKFSTRLSNFHNHSIN